MIYHFPKFLSEFNLRKKVAISVTKIFSFMHIIYFEVDQLLGFASLTFHLGFIVVVNKLCILIFFSSTMTSIN